MKGRSPAFQWYPKDHLTDEHVINMTLEEEGAYRRLMDYSWLHGSIPKEFERMALLCKITPEHMERLWVAIEPCFREDPDDPKRLIHPRLERELEKQTKHRQKKVEAGKAGAKRRWGNSGDGTAIADPPQLPLANHGFTSSSPSSITEKERENLAIEEVFNYWVEQRNRVNGRTRGPKMKATDQRLGKIRARLREHYTVADLREAIDGCFQNPYNLKHGYTDIELICRNQGKVEAYRTQSQITKADREDGDGSEWVSKLAEEWDAEEQARD